MPSDRDLLLEAVYLDFMRAKRRLGWYGFVDDFVTPEIEDQRLTQAGERIVACDWCGDFFIRQRRDQRWDKPGCRKLIKERDAKR